MTKHKLIIAGGGTGGHLFPGLAVAEEWVARGGEVLFVGSIQGLEKTLIPKYGYRLEMVPISQLKGKGIKKKLATLLMLPRAIWKSFRILRKEKADCVLGIGGYASGPMMLAAALCGKKTAVIDPNAMPGVTNRFLGKWAKKVLISYEEAGKFFNPRKVVVTGNPALKRIRNSVKEYQNSKVHSLLVCGGSQGAHRINEKVVESVDALKKEFPDLFLYHQTGVADYEWVKGEYQKRNYDFVVAPFFDDLEKKYAAVSTVIARSGAGTVTELSLWGLPSILIPYPTAADDHQTKNAEVLSKVGGAALLKESELTPNLLVSTLKDMWGSAGKLEEMSRKAKTKGQPEAAKKVVDILLEL